MKNLYNKSIVNDKYTHYLRFALLLTFLLFTPFTSFSQSLDKASIVENLWFEGKAKMEKDFRNSLDIDQEKLNLFLTVNDSLIRSEQMNFFGEFFGMNAKPSDTEKYFKKLKERYTVYYNHFEKNINDASLVLKITHEENAFLLTGDIQEKAMRAMMGSGVDLGADVLKVPHHGAKWKQTGRAFGDAVHPNFSLISSGARNPFGHPHPDTLSALSERADNRVLRTDQNGAIRLLSDGKSIVLDG